MARDLGSKFFESDLAIGVGQYLASLATRNVSGNSSHMNPPQNGVQRPANDFETFIQNVLNPVLLRHYIQGFTGGEFAGWLYDGYPDRVVQLQTFTHPMMPGLKGANAIIPGIQTHGEHVAHAFIGTPQWGSGVHGIRDGILRWETGDG